MRVLVILNPFANHHQAVGESTSVEMALSEAGLEYEIVSTQSRGHAKGLAASASGYDAVVAAGGDGTVNEVVNGLLSVAGEGQSQPLGILPLGTGNDFSDMAGLPRDLTAAAEIIARGNTRQIDAGEASFAESSGSSDGEEHWQRRYFDNSCGVAMEPSVALEVERMTHLSGNIRYIVGMLRGYIKLKAWQMEIHWDGGCIESPTLLLSVANTPRTGGVFNVAPHASLDDGLFDVVFAPDMPKLEVLTILPRLFKGSHINHKKITTLRTTRLWIKSEPGTPLHVDGELVSESATIVNYQMLPGKITLLSR
ncbi:MAG TPA: diacylglycerol kinase family protein [candidate division Zixibacteria bacterium]|nr:diacylglycerol kinase family protein [candidate division Zixibacteria bacterium]